MKDIFNIKATFAKERLKDLWEAYENGVLAKENFTVFALCDYQKIAGKDGHAVFFSKRNSMMGKYPAELQKLLPDDLYEIFVEALQAFGTPEGAEICQMADSVLRDCDEVVTDILKDYAVKRKLI